MNLTQLKQGQSATIVNIDANSALRNRLNSLGLFKGEKLTFKRSSIARDTIEIEVGSTSIALRSEEAQKIEVEL